MNSVSPQVRNLAKQLQAFETPRNTSTGVDNPAAFRAVDKLRLHLSMLLGRSGFQALLSRALVRATGEVPWLSAVQVVADGELKGLTALPTGAFDTTDFSEGEVNLVAQLLGLLVAFIGAALTLRLVTQIWPRLSFNDLDFSVGANNEKTK